MHRTIRVAVVVALCGAGAATPPPAVTAHTSVCVVSGEARTIPLAYPDVLSLTPRTGWFWLFVGAGSGVGGCASVDGVISPMSVTGVLTGWCGHSVGQGTFHDGDRPHDFSYISSGSILVVTAPFWSPTVTVGLAQAVPLPNSGGGPNSCLRGDADTFQVTGIVAHG